MCTCNNFCPKCDPGIEAFYQEKVKKAKEAEAYFATMGVIFPYENMLDAKDIWYEYCELRLQEEADEYWEHQLQQESTINDVNEFDEISAEDMERDAEIEMQMMSEVLEREIAYQAAYRKEEEDRAKINRNQ